MNNTYAPISSEALLNIVQRVNQMQNGSSQTEQLQRITDELIELLKDSLFGGQFRRASDLIEELTDTANKEGFEQGYSLCLQFEKARNDLRAKYAPKTPCKPSNG